MTCTEQLLRGLSARIESELKPRLSGLFGGVVRGYLPQAWEFRTEDGSTTVHVDRDGAAHVSGGAPPHPDVTIEIPHDGLKSVLTKGRRGSLRPEQVKVTAHSSKGKTAFELLRSRFGI